MKKIRISLALVAALMLTLPICAQDWANLGKYEQANADLAPKLKQEKRVVMMGNSITEKWERYDAAFFADNGYINRGISGQVTSQMLLRFRPDVINIDADVVIILAGTNDIAENKGPITIEQIAGNIFSMVELAQANNIEVIMCSALPAISYSWRPAIKPADKIVELNALLYAYAKANKIKYVDYYTPMVNDEKGLIKKYGRDTVHPSIEGYKVMEALLTEAIN